MYINFSFIFIFGQSWSKILAHLTLTVRNLTPTSITSIATPLSPVQCCVLCVRRPRCYTTLIGGIGGCLNMKFCIKCTSMYMVIRNEVKVMLFRLSAPRIFDQDCSFFRNVEVFFVFFFQYLNC